MFFYFIIFIIIIRLDIKHQVIPLLFITIIFIVVIIEGKDWGWGTEQ